MCVSVWKGGSAVTCCLVFVYTALLTGFFSLALFCVSLQHPSLSLALLLSHSISISCLHCPHSVYLYPLCPALCLFPITSPSLPSVSLLLSVFPSLSVFFSISMLLSSSESPPYSSSLVLPLPLLDSLLLKGDVCVCFKPSRYVHVAQGPNNNR